MKQDELEQLIEEHYGLIIKVASEQAGRYVSVENDDVFSVALIAFKEAVEKYDSEKGPFIAYVKLVMKSRIIDYQRKEAKHQTASLDQLVEEEHYQIEDPAFAQEDDLKEEIIIWKDELHLFNISLEQLADDAPKHQDTRNRALKISEKSSQHEPITQVMFTKYRLPIKLTAEHNRVSEKIIKGSKNFIISGIIIFYRGLKGIIMWTRGDQNDNL